MTTQPHSLDETEHQQREAAVDQILAGGGTMGELMRATRWESTPLGPVEQWPQSLRTVVSVCLNSRFPILVWWGRDLVKLYNDAYVPILGSKHPQSLARRGREVWPEIWEIIGPMLEGVLERGDATWSEDIMLPLHRSGFPEECYFTFSYSPIRDESGRVGGVFTAVSETTERVLSERRLITLRRLGKRPVIAIGDVAEACRAMVSVLDESSGDIPFALLFIRDDNGGDKLLVTSQLAVSSDFLDATRHADAWSIQDVIESGLPKRVTNLPEPFRAVSSQWGDLVTEAVVLPIAKLGQVESEGALVVGLSPRLPFTKSYADFLTLVADQVASGIASARAYESERRRAEALAEIDREKTAFFSNVSHEFRTPLTLLLGPLKELLSNPANGEQFAELEMAHRNALRLLKLVNTLLDFARIEAGRAEAQFETVDLARLTRDIASTFRSAIEQSGMGFVIEADDSLPDVRVDRDMWEKVVLNLVSNAYKHTFEGEIRLALRRRGQSVALTVSDTGIGIPSNHVDRVFDRFHRVPTARSRSYEGSGIGLALVRELVILQGGQISVESTPGSGSAFTISLPGCADAPGVIPNSDATGGDAALRETDASNAYLLEAMQWSGSASRAVDQAATDSRYVLVADDNADMRAYMLRLLSSNGYRVRLANTGAEALDAILGDPPDVVVADVMMPEMDGVALVRKLRSRDETRGIPVIMVSARAGEEARISGLDAGADDYLVKPFTGGEFLARVRVQMRLANLSRSERRARNLAEKLSSEMSRVFEQAPIAIAVFEGEALHYTLANPSYRQMIGNRNPVGQTLTEVFPELIGTEMEDMLGNAYRTGIPFSASEFHARFALERSGEPSDLWFNFACHPLTGANGEVTGVVLIVINVSDQVLRRRQVEELRSIAESASTAKSELLRTVSHETRQPVHASLGFLSMLDMELHGPLNPQQRDDLGKIRRNQEHLLSILNDILTFSRTEAGGLHFDISTVNVCDLLDELDALVAPQLAAKGVRYSAVCHDQNLDVRADQDRAIQILVNLVTNALKFTEAGGFVRVEATSDDAFAKINVTDNGIGIAAEKLEEIFDPFTQLGKHIRTSSGGVGLGLAICRQLSRAMGGNVTVSSEIGEGSRFTLDLPKA